MNNPIIITGDRSYTKSKNVKYKRNCNTCGKKYFGWGREVCSKNCLRPPRLEKSPFWKGENITNSTGRQRAEKMYYLLPCQKCGSKNSERHHIDSNPKNNNRSNIMFVCRKHHVAIDGRMVKARQARNHPSIAPTL